MHILSWSITKISDTAHLSIKYRPSAIHLKVAYMEEGTKMSGQITSQVNIVLTVHQDMLKSYFPHCACTVYHTSISYKYKEKFGVFYS